MRTHLVAGAAALGAILVYWVAFAALTIVLGITSTHPLLALAWFGGALAAAVITYAKVVGSRSEKASDGTKATP